MHRFRRLAYTALACLPMLACTSSPGNSTDAGLGDIRPIPERDAGNLCARGDGGAADSGEAGASDAGRGGDGAAPKFPVPLSCGLAPTPPMGWSSWNAFGCNVNENDIKHAAEALVSSGMAAAGYRYVNIDDCWSFFPPTPSADAGDAGKHQCSAALCRTAAGVLQPNPSTFPDGIAAIADYVHGLGLSFGIYGDRGRTTCAGREGSEGFETIDARTFASWGVDYLKYDNCAAKEDIDTDYTTMRNALDATRRPIVLSMSAWQFYEWGVGVGQLWRTTLDIKNTNPEAAWKSTVDILGHNAIWAAYAGPNGWNDPDAIQAGNGRLTDTEAQAQFSLWAVSAAPLITSTDLTKLSSATKSILTNREVIAIDQDALGLAGVPVRADSSVWAKPLDENGARAVVLFNTSDEATKMSFQWSEVGLADTTASVRDLVAHADRGSFPDGYGIEVPSHGTATLKVVGTEPKPPFGPVSASELIWTYAANGSERQVQKNTNWDGKPLRMAGKVYAKGLGVVAPSLVVYRVAPNCTKFTAEVGLDDSGRDVDIDGGSVRSGSVVFQVWGDGEKLYDSGSIKGATSAVKPVSVPLAGHERLRLLVTNDQDGAAFDRADWVNAQLVCP